MGRAITEAAQTRITNIAGGRDDFMPTEYFEPVDDSIAFLRERGAGQGHAPGWLPADTPLPEVLGTPRRAHRADRRRSSGANWAARPMASRWCGRSQPYSRTGKPTSIGHQANGRCRCWSYEGPVRRPLALWRDAGFHGH